MKITRRKIKRIDISESGALSDLAFLLIIFFIVIAVFNVNSGYLLGLPQKNSTRIVNTKDILKIDLLNTGQIRLKDDYLSIEILEKMIKQNLAIYPNMTILLRVQGEVSYQKVVNIVEIVRQLEVENFSFKMLQEVDL